MTQFIEIVISPNGQSIVETQGFAGESCRDASRFIEDALGSRISEQLLPEFHQTQAQEQCSSQRQES